MERIFFEGSSSDEFTRQLCSKIKEIVDSSIKKLNYDPEELLTREDTAKLLKITLPTLNTWTKAGWLNPIYKGRRVYYKKSEVINNPKS